MRRELLCFVFALSCAVGALFFAGHMATDTHRHVYPWPGRRPLFVQCFEGMGEGNPSAFGLEALTATAMMHFVWCKPATAAGGTYPPGLRPVGEVVPALVGGSVQAEVWVNEF